MTTETTTNQETSPGILLTEISKLQTFGILMTHVVVPLLALSALVSGSTKSLHVFTVVLTLAGAETLLMLVSYTVLISRAGLRVAHGVSIVVHFLLTAYWFFGLSENGLLYTLLTGYVVILLWRIDSTGRSESVAESNRSAFVVDTVALFLLSIYYYAWAVPMGGAVPTAVTPLFAFLVLMGVLLRIYSLWRLERLTFNTRSTTPPWIVWTSLSIVLLAVVGLHQWVFRLLQLVSLGITALLKPLLSDLPLPSHWKIRLPKLSDLPSAASKLPKKQVHHVVMPVLLGFYMILIAVIIAGVLFWLLRGRKRRVKENETGDVEPEIIRQSLADMRRKRFLQTDNPVRIQAQRWLQKQLKRGGTISAKLSFRTMVHRSGEQGTQLESLVNAYEEERYGPNTSLKQGLQTRQSQIQHSDESQGSQ